MLLSVLSGFIGILHVIHVLVLVPILIKPKYLLK